MEPWGNSGLNQTDPPKYGQFMWEHNHCIALTGHPVQMSQTQGIWGDPLSVGLASWGTERGCSKGMPWQGWSFTSGAHAQISCVTGSIGLTWLLRQKNTSANATCGLVFKAKQPKAPFENIMAIHPIELVHLNYLFLEPGKGPRGKCSGGNRPFH